MPNAPMKSSPKPDTMQSQDTAPCVVLERLSMRYGRGPEILKDIDLTLESGSFTFLTGISGAGKTTLLKMIYLGLKPSRGLISLFGQDTSQLNQAELQTLKRRIGIVLQDFDLIDHLSVFENVALPLRIAGQKREHYESDVRELLQWVGLGQKLQARPATLSGGEKQRAAIARAVITKPELLIADEPTGNVDPDIGRRLLRLFIEMNRMGTTILIATHDDKLIKTPSRIIRLEKSHLLDIGISDD